MSTIRLEIPHSFGVSESMRQRVGRRHAETLEPAYAPRLGDAPGAGRCRELPPVPQPNPRGPLPMANAPCGVQRAAVEP